MSRMVSISSSGFFGFRVADVTAFFYLGTLVEVGATSKIFSTPEKKQTEDYVTGRFG